MKPPPTSLNLYACSRKLIIFYLNSFTSIDFLGIIERMFHCSAVFDAFCVNVEQVTLCSSHLASTDSVFTQFILEIILIFIWEITLNISVNWSIIITNTDECVFLMHSFFLQIIERLFHLVPNLLNRGKTTIGVFHRFRDLNWILILLQGDGWSYMHR